MKNFLTLLLLTVGVMVHAQMLPPTNISLSPSLPVSPCCTLDPTPPWNPPANPNPPVPLPPITISTSPPGEEPQPIIPPIQMPDSPSEPNPFPIGDEPGHTIYNTFKPGGYNPYPFHYAP